MEGLLIGGVDALIIVPTDANAIIHPVKKFFEKGIPVIAMDTTLNDLSLLKCEVTSDNKLGGYEAGILLAKAIGEEGKVVIANTEMGASATDLRQQGFEEVIASEYPKIEIVNTYFCKEDRNLAASQIQNALLANPDIKGVFATCTNPTVGAAKGLSLANASNVILVGYDADPSEVKALENNEIDFLVVQKPLAMGYLAVEYAYKILIGEGEYIPSKALFATVTATPENMDDENINKYFYPIK